MARLYCWTLSYSCLNPQHAKLFERAIPAFNLHIRRPVCSIMRLCSAQKHHSDQIKSHILDNIPIGDAVHAPSFSPLSSSITVSTRRSTFWGTKPPNRDRGSDGSLLAEHVQRLMPPSRWLPQELRTMFSRPQSPVLKIQSIETMSGTNNKRITLDKGCPIGILKIVCTCLSEQPPDMRTQIRRILLLRFRPLFLVLESAKFSASFCPIVSYIYTA